jgi:hypothetical protein
MFRGYKIYENHILIIKAFISESYQVTAKILFKYVFQYLVNASSLLIFFFNCIFLQSLDVSVFSKPCCKLVRHTFSRSVLFCFAMRAWVIKHPFSEIWSIRMDEGFSRPLSRFYQFNKPLKELLVLDLLL